MVRYVNKAEGSLLAIPTAIKLEAIFGTRYGQEISLVSSLHKSLIATLHQVFQFYQKSGSSQMRGGRMPEPQKVHSKEKRKGGMLSGAL